MPQRLPDKTYQDLIARITAIYTQANQAAMVATDHIHTQACWLIGKEIIEVQQDGKLHARYGDHLLEQLALELTELLGRGFSETNLGYMRKFYLTHPIPQQTGELNWTVHCQLLTIKDDKKREMYEKKAAAGKWTKMKLIEILRRDKVDRKALESAKEDAAAQTGTVRKVTVKRGIPGLYRLKQVAKPGPEAAEDSLTLMVDCGFYVYRELGLKDAHKFQEGDIVRPVETKAGLRFELAQADKKEIYTYRARVTSVVDGDTLVCVIDFGFGNFVRQRLRLRGIDAPELKTARGQKARGFVKVALAEVAFVVIKTYQEEKYGRYLSDLFWLPGEDDPAVVAREGRFLNQVLLDEGLAVRV